MSTEDSRVWHPVGDWLELALLIDDPMQRSLRPITPMQTFQAISTDISWLMSNQARLDRLETLHKWVLIGQPSRISRVFDFYDIAR